MNSFYGIIADKKWMKTASRSAVNSLNKNIFTCSTGVRLSHLAAALIKTSQQRTMERTMKQVYTVSTGPNQEKQKSEKRKKVGAGV